MEVALEFASALDKHCSEQAEKFYICYKLEKKFRMIVALQLHNSKEKVFAWPKLQKLCEGMALLFI